MLVYYFVPFIVSNRYLLFWVSNGHNSVTVKIRTHVYMNFFDHKDIGNHLLQLCPKVVKHPVYHSLCFSTYRAVKAFSLGYKKQSVKAAKGNNSCLFCDSSDTNKGTLWVGYRISMQLKLVANKATISIWIFNYWNSSVLPRNGQYLLDI